MKAALAAGKIVLICVLAISSFSRNNVFRDDVSFWSDAVEQNPGSNRCRANLAGAYVRNDALDKAAEVSRSIIRDFPNDFVAHEVMGVYYESIGRDDDAMREFLTCVSLHSGTPNVFINIGNLYLKKGNLGRALEFFVIASQLQPANGGVHYSLGFIYDRLGEKEKAVREFETSAQLDPANTRAIESVRLLRGSGHH